jgi:hypothetical protein
MSWKHGVVYLLVLAFLAAFPYGPLFAWSPVHSGYLKLRFTRADVLYPEGGPLDAAYRDVDRFVAMAEAFHRLRYSKRITVHSDLFDAVHQWNMGRWRSLAA